MSFVLTIWLRMCNFVENIHFKICRIMKRISLIIVAVLAVVLSGCQLGGGSGFGGRMPRSNSGYTDEEKEEIMDQNNPLRQGVTYFHSEAMDYSLQYPNSFVDFKKDGDNGFSCHSKDGVATLKAWGENCSLPIEDLMSKMLKQYNSDGAQVSETNLDDDSFVIEGDKGNKHFYQRTILHDGKSATMYYEFNTEERDDIDPEAIYSSLGFELGESLIPGAPPVEAQPKKADPNAVAQVAYVGEWHIFSTMRYEDPYKKYPEFKDVNAWEASTDGEEVYLILAIHDDAKITVKNTKTGERLYNSDSRPLVVRCNENGEPDMEITIIDNSGNLTRYVPRHDENNHPVTAPGIIDMTR